MNVGQVPTDVWSMVWFMANSTKVNVLFCLFVVQAKASVVNHASRHPDVSAPFPLRLNPCCEISAVEHVICSCASVASLRWKLKFTIRLLKYFALLQQVGAADLASPASFLFRKIAFISCLIMFALIFPRCFRVRINVKGG